MAAQYEIAFIQHIVLPGSLDEVIDRNLPLDVLPTEALRPIHAFAIEYWHTEASRGTAPSPAALKVHFGNLLAEHEIDLDIDPEDTLDWALAALQGAYQNRFQQTWLKEFAVEAAEADILDFPNVIDNGIEKLMELQGKFVSSGEHVDAREATDSMMRAYEERARLRLSGEVNGMVVGLPVRAHEAGRFVYPPGVEPTLEEIDRHTSGIREGELAILAAPPKTGKSYFLLASAYKNWRAGRIPVLFSLENSIAMTMDRLCCMAAGVDVSLWDKGDVSEYDIERMNSWRQAFSSEETPFHILQPEPGQRSAEHMVRQARILGTDLFIDQLTFMEHGSNDRIPKTQQIGNSLHKLKSLISTGRKRMPCMMAHQINREGVKAAEKDGRLEMYHLAESAEVERTADWVFGLWQDEVMKQGGVAYLQTLASRRADQIHWQLGWEPWRGYIEVQADVTAALNNPDGDD